jgi:hypothetical protein
VTISISSEQASDDFNTLLLSETWRVLFFVVPLLACAASVMQHLFKLVFRLKLLATDDTLLTLLRRDCDFRGTVVSRVDVFV